MLSDDVVFLTSLPLPMTVEVTTDTTMEINGHNHMLILSCRTQVLLVLVLSNLLLITREMTTHITTSLFLAKGGATPY